MKKYVLIAAVAVLGTAGVTAAMLGTQPKKAPVKKEVKKDCPAKKSCSRSMRTACFGL